MQMVITTINPSTGAVLLLELFNGGSVLLEGVFLLWALRYLWLEKRRRNLRLLDWARFPPSMGFIVAVMTFDFASWLRSLVIWSWRRFYHSGEFMQWHLILLVLAGGIGIVGALCKIRAVTKPDYGDEPWLICLALTLVFVAASVAARIAFPS